MNTYSRVVFCCLVFLLAISLASFSYAQYTTQEKPAQQEPPGTGAEQATPVPRTYSETAGPEKPGQKVIPEDLTANLNTSFYSKYVWRGYELSKNSLVIFPSATIGYKGFAFNVWVDFDTDFHNPPPGQSNHKSLQETDLTLTYSNKFQPLKLNYTVGWIYYDTDGFHGNRPTSNQELFVTLGLDWSLLRPTLSFYREIETGAAYYANLGVSHGFNVYKDWTLDVGGWISYLYNHSTLNYSNVHDGNLWSSLTVPLTPFWSVAGKIQYSFPLSHIAQDQIAASSFNGKDSKWVYGGIIFDRHF